MLYHVLPGYLLSKHYPLLIIFIYYYDTLVKDIAGFGRDMAIFSGGDLLCPVSWLVKLH